VRGKSSQRGGGGSTNANRYTMTKPILSDAGKFTMNYFRIPPRPTFLLGSLDKEVAMVTKKVRQKRAVEKSVEGKETKIKELSGEPEENDKNSTVNEINGVFKTLRKIFKRSGGKIILIPMFICIKTFMNFEIQRRPFVYSSSWSIQSHSAAL
jgi:hypothetical protein